MLLILGLNELRLPDKLEFGFGLEKSGWGRAKHLRPDDNSVMMPNSTFSVHIVNASLRVEIVQMNL